LATWTFESHQGHERQYHADRTSVHRASSIRSVLMGLSLRAPILELPIDADWEMDSDPQIRESGPSLLGRGMQMLRRLALNWETQTFV